MPEQTVVWVVQFWVKKYEYWSNCMEPAEGMFSMPQVGFESEGEGRDKLTRMREEYPTGKYRLVRVTTTIEDVS